MVDYFGSAYARALRWLVEIDCAEPDTRVALEETGRHLIADLRSRIMDLSYDKRTEFSSEIPELIMLMAKLAWLAYPPGSLQVRAFEEDVYRYRNSVDCAVVEDYDAFKQQHPRAV